MSARNTDPETSHEAAAAFSERAGKVNERITELTRAAGVFGITQSQVVDAMPEYKPGSITPRFARLVKRGILVRVHIGIGKPTKQFPSGRPIYKTRIDEATGRKVLVHWVPEFAPLPDETEPKCESKSLEPCARTKDDLDNLRMDSVHTEELH